MLIFHISPMRKYLVRKNFDENNTDPMNAPNRTVFYEKERRSHEQNAQRFSSESEEVESTASLIQTKKIDSEEDQPLLNSEAKKIFQDSLTALNTADKQRNDIIYMQLESEKKISQELNRKLHANLSKIASAEVELVKRKNQLEDELHEKTKQLVSSERMAAIGELSGRLAHELRTPLTVIKGSVGVLKLRKGTEMDNFVMERLALMEESVSRMNHQVEKVLNYVQKIPLDKKDVSLKEVLQKSQSLIESNPNITILTPKNDITFNCDSIKMEIIFGNLLLNAVQAIGKESGQIVIELGETEDSIKITIQDSGSGVPDELGEKIFEPLVSLKQDGTGLGLSSVKNIVEQHNGKISFTNNPTKFTVIFPKVTK